MVCGHDFGFDRTVRDSGLLLALRREREEAVRAVDGEEDTRGAFLRRLVASEVGIGK